MKWIKRSLIAAGSAAFALAALLVTGAGPAIATHVEEAAHVFVSNPPTSPVYVRESAGDPYAQVFTFSLPGQVVQHNRFFTVPAGKRFVIEYVSAQASLPAGQRPRVEFHAATGPERRAASFFLGDWSLGVSGSYGRWDLAEAVRAYAEPGSTLTIGVARSSSSGGSASARVTISGVLVPTS